MINALWKQILSDTTTNSANYVNIPDLNFLLPPSSTNFNAALVTLNLPRPYATEGKSNGIGYQINVNGKGVLEGAWTNLNSQDGRSPFTMAMLVHLRHDQQLVEIQWLAVRGATAHLGGSASLSAILVRV